MVSLTFGVVHSFLSSPTNVLLMLLLVLVIAALWSMHIPAGFPQGPRGLPLIGSLVAFATDPMYTLTDLAKKYGDIFSLKLGMQRIVVLSNIELVREALVKKQNAFAGRPMVHSLDLFSEGGEDIAAGNFTQKWKTLRKIAHQAISYELDDTEFKDILKFIQNFNESFGNGLLADVVPIFKYIPTNGLRAFKKNLNKWFSLIQSKIDGHKIKTQEGNVSDLVDDVLKIQAEAKAAGEDQADLLTDVNVRQVVADIFGAGIDTTINTMNWCIAYMVNYPDVQTKVQEEIDDVIGQRLPLLTDKTKLPYCEAVIHEVMRIRTVAPVSVPHETTEDTSVGGYNIPKGTQIWTNLWKLHMDEKYWTEPEQFRPERFLDEDGQALPKQDSFLPFSAGRRVCVGEVLAKNEMLLIFTCLFQQFTFLPAPGKEKPSLEPTFQSLVTRCIPYDVVARERISRDSCT
ncbi:steroid 17-alpha-hydroxylase/17,20 lyase-like isoform X2 [Ptychodera flava]|uniref:steroid 17-alpha-hydroxylase/17,20 lyase-like isoform X2 n=1 Tax=Ptychodera flava TaxID=63121 RepID=UPI00396A28BE